MEERMNIAKLKSELDRVNGAIVDKIGKQPFIRASLTLNFGGQWRAGACYPDREMGERLDGRFCDTPEAAMKSLFDVVDRIPDPDTKAKRDWQGKLGSVIDEGHALNLPDEVMNPLRQGSQAMTENLLAAPEEAS